MISNRVCPICLSPRKKLLHHIDFIQFDNSPLPNQYNIISCSKCGFVFADIQTNQTILDEFYIWESKYQDDFTATGGGKTPWDRDRLAETAKIISEFSLGRDSKIVDIGCGNGGLVECLKGLGFASLYGVDPAFSCIRNVSRIGGVFGIQGTLTNLPLRSGTFDLVILSHVLEHIYDLKNAVSRIYDVVSPDGLIYIETPDASSYRTFNFSPFQEFNHEHINHFSLQSLQNLLKANDFEPLLGASKIVFAGIDKPYPTIYLLAMKSSSISSATRNIVPDNDLVIKINEYIKDSKEMIFEYEVQIKNIMAENERIIVWGTGALARKLLSYSSLGLANIICFIDSNPIYHGRLLNGVITRSPQSLLQIQDVAILVATTLHSEEIKHQIFEMGITNPIYFLR